MLPGVTSRSRAQFPAGVPADVEIPDATIPDLLARAAADFPDRLAVDFLGRKTSYAKLADRVERAAALFHNLGVQKGDVVALVMPNTTQHIVAALGALRIGAVVAEHNPLAPAAEIQSQLERHGARVVVAWEKALAQVCPAGDLRGRTVLASDLTRDLPPATRRLVHLPIGRARELKDTMRADVPAGVGSYWHYVRRAGRLPGGVAQPAPSDPAFYLHTGGTTGSPKTVPLTHANLVAMVTMGEAWVPSLTRGKETFAAVLPYFHAFGLTLSLIFGLHMAATQVVFPRFDVEMVLSGQRRRPMTFVPAVPPIFDRVEKAARDKKRDLSSIRVAIAGAMPLDGEVARRWEDLTGGLIIEGYGMTECAPIILGNPISPARQPGTLGVAFPNTLVRIVDQDHPERDVREGEVGELIVKGPQVFAGYLDAPEENAELFTADGWLRTGDVVREDDGFITLADRKKELIISGGFNIYPSQVEDAVRMMPGVVDVAVVGVPSGAIGERVVAALVLEAGARVDLESVRAWCDEKLSHYAIPRQIEILQELPKSQLGKTLRRKVQEQIVAASETVRDASERLRSWREGEGEPR